MLDFNAQKNTLTHAIFERRHDLHALPRYPQLVGINIVGGATLFALVSICLHGRAPIFSVKSHTDHRGKVRLSPAETKPVILTQFWFTSINHTNKQLSKLSPEDQTYSKQGIRTFVQSCEGEALADFIM